MAEVFNSLEAGWAYTKKHGLLLSVVVMLMFALAYWLTYMCFPESFWTDYMRTAQKGDVQKMMVLLEQVMPVAMNKIWLVTILQYLMFAGVVNAALSVVIGETDKISLKYLSLPFGTYLKVVTWFCITMLVYILSSYLLMIPFVFFGIRMFYVLPLLLEDPASTVSIAMRRSWIMTKGHFMPLLGFSVISIMFCTVGLFMCFVGFFFTSVVCIYSYLALYRQTKNPARQMNDNN